MKVKNDHSKNATVVSNEIFDDSRLDNYDKMLFLWMFHLPDDWKFSTRGIADRFRGSRNTVSASLKRLQSHGYLSFGEDLGDGYREWILDDMPSNGNLEAGDDRQQPAKEEAMTQEQEPEATETAAATDDYLTIDSGTADVTDATPADKTDTPADDEPVTPADKIPHTPKTVPTTFNAIFTSIMARGVEIHNPKMLEKRYDDVRDNGWKDESGVPIKHLAAYFAKAAAEMPKDWELARKHENFKDTYVGWHNITKVWWDLDYDYKPPELPSHAPSPWELAEHLEANGQGKRLTEAFDELYRLIVIHKGNCPFTGKAIKDYKAYFLEWAVKGGKYPVMEEKDGNVIVKASDTSKNPDAPFIPDSATMNSIDEAFRNWAGRQRMSFEEKLIACEWKRGHTYRQIYEMGENWLRVAEEEIGIRIKEKRMATESQKVH